MEKAVVRRGIGAIVLALVAALLLGFLLKGKAPERKEVVDMKLSPEPITIFPGGNKEGGGEVAATGGEAGKSEAGAGFFATGAATAAAGGEKVVTTAKDGAAKVADKAGQAGASAQNASAQAKDKVVDPETGNAYTTDKIVVDNAGQAVIGNKRTGPSDTPAGFAVRAPAKNEVRPSVERGATVAKTKPENTRAKSNARLVGEKKLPPVGSQKVASTSSDKKSEEKKVASSRNQDVAATTVAPTAGARTSGRNKYVVQLLATSNASKAKQLRTTMRSEGYPAFISTVQRSGKTLYRVRVGTYAGKDTAVKKQGAMKRRYQKNQYVQSSIVVKN